MSYLWHSLWEFEILTYEVSGGLGYGCQPVGSSEFHKLGSTRFVACLVAKKLLEFASKLLKGRQCQEEPRKDSVSLV